MKHTLKILTALLLAPLATLHAVPPDFSGILKTSFRRTVSLLMIAVAVLAGSILTSAFAGDAAALAVPKGLRVASPFSDHMVLQREMVVPVWGEAVPGAEVEVGFAGQTKIATANEKGRWLVKLDRLDTSADGRELTVACGDSKTVFKDVVVGEVWFASGQSNMQMALIDTEGGPDAVKNSADPLLRGLVQGYDSAPAPLDFSTNPPAWELASPETLHKQPTNPTTRPQWSAAAYHMARKLRRELKVPVGIVMASSGATPAQTWTAPEGNAFSDELKDDQSPHLQYNAMIHPLVPYAIRGAIWNQGENNIRQAGETAFY